MNLKMINDPHFNNMIYTITRWRLWRAQSCRLVALFLLASIMLAGCGGGAGTESNPNSGGGTSGQICNADTQTIQGSSLGQSFKLEFFNNLKSEGRCGGSACHGTGGASAALFVDCSSLNSSHNVALSQVSLTTPASSALVAKVASGHNCWRTSNAACRDDLIRYITNWASVPGATAGRQIQLDPLAFLRDPSASRVFPANATDNAPNSYVNTIHPILTAQCAGCHSNAARLSEQQAPFFANADVDSAYDAAKGKIYLGDADIITKGQLSQATLSRLIVRLRDEIHNCWDTGSGSIDCAASALVIQDAIYDFANAITATAIDPTLLTSKALVLDEGTIAAGANRHETNLAALYEFRTGFGATIYDKSAVSPPLDLTLEGVEDVDYQWVGGWGIEFMTDTARAWGLTANSQKLHSMITASGEYSIEAWVVAGNLDQGGPARMINYSAGVNTRNFTLGQSTHHYEFFNRSTSADANGEPTLRTADDVILATQQHVVATFDPVNGRRIYINGALTDDVDPQAGDGLSNWDDTFSFMLGNDVGNPYPWRGKLRLVAIHDRALTQQQVVQNFEADVGEKRYMLFDISDWVEISDSYIIFEVSQFDNYSYLFTNPTYRRLGTTATFDSFDIKGMRIGINGRESPTGQAYVNIDETITASGQLLSRLGTTIPLEKGPTGQNSDEFFLTFETIWTNSRAYEEPDPVVPQPPADADAVSDIGLRTFNKINASMSVLTGVSTTDPAIGGANGTYTQYKLQLPGGENIEAFLSSHQMAIAQLALAYCNVLVDADDGYFAGFNYLANASTAFDTPTKRNQIIDPLLTQMLNSANNLLTQPLVSDVRAELNSLIDTMTVAACMTDPDPDIFCDDAARTAQIVKGTCAATLGSAVMLIQ